MKKCCTETETQHADLYFLHETGGESEGSHFTREDSEATRKVVPVSAKGGLRAVDTECVRPPWGGGGGGGGGGAGGGKSPPPPPSPVGTSWLSKGPSCFKAWMD